MERDYLGKGWKFPPTFLGSGSTVEMVAEEEDIQESLEILLQTARNERVMRPDFGADTKDLVFEPQSLNFQTFLADRIQTAILKYEPRIEVNEIRLDQEFGIEGVVKLHIDYTIIATNTRTNLVFPFYKLEATHASIESTPVE